MDAEITGTITINGISTEFRISKDQHGYPWVWQQWGGTQIELGERVDLLEQMVYGLRHGIPEE